MRDRGDRKRRHYGDMGDKKGDMGDKMGDIGDLGDILGDTEI